eukprot:scaffold139212_cov38-Tisochrysis_lutea.AAC.2
MSLLRDAGRAESNVARPASPRRVSETSSDSRAVHDASPAARAAVALAPSVCPRRSSAVSAFEEQSGP